MRVPENTSANPEASLALTEKTKPEAARFSWHFFLGPHISSLNYYIWMLPSMFEVEALFRRSPCLWLLLFPYRSKTMVLRHILWLVIVRAEAEDALHILLCLNKKLPQ